MTDYDTNPVVEYVPDVNMFPDPQRYATYMIGRSPKFKTHAGLGHAKLAMSGQVRAGRLIHDAYVYEFDFEAGTWRVLARIPRDTKPGDHPWYQEKQSSKRKSLGPSKAAEDAAIASILGRPAPKCNCTGQGGDVYQDECPIHSPHRNV